MKWGEKTPQLTNWETRDQSLAPSLTSGVSLDQNISNNILLFYWTLQIVSNEGEEAEHVLLLCSEEETEAQRDEMICPYSLLQTGDSQVNNLYRPAYSTSLNCDVSSDHCQTANNSPHCTVLLLYPSVLSSLPAPLPQSQLCQAVLGIIDSRGGCWSQTLFVFSK